MQLSPPIPGASQAHSRMHVPFPITNMEPEKGPYKDHCPSKRGFMSIWGRYQHEGPARGANGLGIAAL